MPILSGSGSPFDGPPTYMGDSILNQAAPVQNTWYTILATTLNCCLFQVAGMVADTGETIEFRVTIDGKTISGSQVAVANTIYFIGLNANSTTAATQVWPQGTAISVGGTGTQLCGKSVKVEIRKTTNAGNGNLSGKAVYSKW